MVSAEYALSVEDLYNIDETFLANPPQIIEEHFNTGKKHPRKNTNISTNYIKRRSSPITTYTPVITRIIYFIDILTSTNKWMFHEN